MRRTERRRFEPVDAGSLSQLEAAELLGMSERTFRRWTTRFEAEGEEGFLDRRLGRRSGRAVPDDDAAAVERLYRDRYAGFTAKHFHEHLVRDHGVPLGLYMTSLDASGGLPLRYRAILSLPPVGMAVRE